MTAGTNDTVKGSDAAVRVSAAGSIGCSRRLVNSRWHGVAPIALYGASRRRHRMLLRQILLDDLATRPLSIVNSYGA